MSDLPTFMPPIQGDNRSARIYASMLGFTGVQQKRAVSASAIDLIIIHVLTFLKNEDLSFDLKADRLLKFVLTLAGLNSSSRNEILDAIFSLPGDLCTGSSVEGTGEDVGCQSFIPDACVDLLFERNGESSLSSSKLLFFSVNHPRVWTKHVFLGLESAFENGAEKTFDLLLPFLTSLEMGHENAQKECIESYIKHPFLNQYLCHEVYSSVLATGSSILGELLRLIYSRVVPLIPGMQNDDRQAYFTEEIVNNFLASRTAAGSGRCYY